MDIILEKFIKTLNSESSKKAYSLDLKKFMKHFSDRNIFLLGDRTLIEYLNNLETREGKPVKHSTYNRSVNAIKSFYRWLYQTNQISKPKLLNFKIKARNKTISSKTSIPQEVFEKILENTNLLRDKLIFTLMYEAGLKISEVLSLNLGDITEEYIFVRGGYFDREVTVTDNIYKMFKEYINQDRSYVIEFYTLQHEEVASTDLLPLFISYQTGRSIGYHMLNLNFKRSSAKYSNADGSRLSLSQLRYSYIFSQLETTNPEDLCKKIGITDIRNLAYYEREDQSLFSDPKNNLTKTQ